MRDFESGGKGAGRLVAVEEGDEGEKEREWEWRGGGR